MQRNNHATKYLHKKTDSAKMSNKTANA